MCDLTPLEMCMGIELGLFQTYAEGGDKMTKDGFIKLLKDQMPGMAANLTSDCEGELFKTVDLNDDGFVTFPEFCNLVSNMCLMHMDIFNEMSQKAQVEQQRKK